MWSSWTSTMHYQVILAVLSATLIAYVCADDTNNEQKRAMAYVPLGFDEFAPYSNFYGLEDSADDRPKRENANPGLLRFGKRSQSFVRFGRSVQKKEMPGVLRFGKRDADMPGVLRFGKRDADMPGVLRFGKRDAEIPGLLRFGRK